MYKVTITFEGGKRMIFDPFPTDDGFDFYGLQSMLDKCVIKSYSVRLSTK